LYWTKTTIATARENTELITAMLLNLGIHGVEIHDPQEMETFLTSATSTWDYIDEALLPTCTNEGTSIIFYTGTDKGSQDLLSQLKSDLDGISSELGSHTIVSETVNDESWLHEWKKHFHPIKIGQVQIVPEWDTAPPQDGTVFTIDPGSAFGTGQHATTALCIEALQKWLKPHDTILDIGCGSGILSIIGLLLGAKKAVACDIDSAAIEVARRNAALNPIDSSSLDLHIGDILTNTNLHNKINNQKYNIIAANIVADVIIKLAPLIRNLLSPEGNFMASGIITERLDDVLHALTSNALTIHEVKTREGWCCVIAHE